MFSGFAKDCMLGDEDPTDGGAGAPGDKADAAAGGSGGSSSSSGSRKSDSDVEANRSTPGRESFAKNAARLAFCIVGLQGSYLTWGVLQELIMTRSYGEDEDGSEDKDNDEGEGGCNNKPGKKNLPVCGPTLAYAVMYAWSHGKDNKQARACAPSPGASI